MVPVWLAQEMQDGAIIIPAKWPAIDLTSAE